MKAYKKGKDNEGKEKEISIPNPEALIDPVDFTITVLTKWK